jgi:hypothetical protein
MVQHKQDVRQLALQPLQFAYFMRKDDFEYKTARKKRDSVLSQDIRL